MSDPNRSEQNCYLKKERRERKEKKEKENRKNKEEKRRKGDEKPKQHRTEQHRISQRNDNI